MRARTETKDDRVLTLAELQSVRSRLVLTLKPHDEGKGLRSVDEGPPASG